MPATITLLVGDLTALHVEAIVNAANPGLLGGGGVDGAIHHAAGPRLLTACRDLPMVEPGVRCRTGEARITPGFDLPARYVIHTVGPVWQGGGRGEPDLLAACHRNALQLARAHGITSIAFPAISCGVYGYPPTRAARVALTTLREALGADDPIDVQVCLRDAAMAAIWRAALSAV